MTTLNNIIKNQSSDYADVDSGEKAPQDVTENEFTLGEFFKRKRL